MVTLSLPQGGKDGWHVLYSMIILIAEMPEQQRNPLERFLLLMYATDAREIQTYKQSSAYDCVET